MSSQALAVHTQESWNTILAMAPTIAGARMFGLTQEQVAVLMVVADELNIGRGIALNGLLFAIDTPTGKKVALSAACANALIQKSGKVQVQITDHVDAQGNPTGCTVHMKRTDNGNEYTATFTIQDAQRINDADVAAGRKTPLLSKSNWQSYPADMYFSRAYMRCARRVAADIIANMYTPEELGWDTDNEGAPIPSPVVVTTPLPAIAAPTPPPPPIPPAAPQAQQPAAEMTVADILNAGFSAEQIVVANEGRIPASSEDCVKVLAKLQAGA